MYARRVLRDEVREVVLVVDGRTITETTARASRSCEHARPLGALVALHRRATALTRAGMFEDTAASSGRITLGDVGLGATFELPLGRAEVERRLGDALAEAGAPALPFATPLLLLDWPVGYRFAALFEARPRDRAARAAVAAAIAALDDRDLPAAGELLRIALVQRNAAALGAALALLPRARSFDLWMDVLELAHDIGGHAHAERLRALGRGRVPRDAREPLRELVRELSRRA